MRPSYLEVNLSQLRRNMEAIRAQVAPAKVMPMVKANAYGHGIDGVASFIEPYVDYLGVALVEEGIHLRELGIRKPILVAGGTLEEQVPLFAEDDLTLTSSPRILLWVRTKFPVRQRRKIRLTLKLILVWKGWECANTKQKTLSYKLLRVSIYLLKVFILILRILS